MYEKLYTSLYNEVFFIMMISRKSLCSKDLRDFFIFLKLGTILAIIVVVFLYIFGRQ
jgi:hypothetical protein